MASCGRCGGFLVVEHGHSEVIVGSTPWMGSTRCVNCGNLEDSLIRMNRAMGSLVARTVRSVKALSGVRNNHVIGQSS